MSKLFVVYAEKLTENLHQEGTAIIVASSMERARELLPNGEIGSWSPELTRDVTDAEWAEAKVYNLAGDAEESVTICPNAGCC